MKVNVACVQMQPKLGDIHYNLSRMNWFVEEIMSAKPQTELIVFPELITSGYECGNEFQNLSETVENGASIQQISALALKHKVHIVFGFPQRDSNSNDVLYNSAVLIGPEGQTIGVFQKVHLFDTEKNYFRPGSSYPLFETKIGKIGIMICWDTAFPEVARIYALKGAELLIIPTNWEKPYTDDWVLSTSARALDNCIYIASANRVGRDKVLEFCGHSRILGPQGKSIDALNNEEEGYITAELDYTVPVKLKHDYYTYFEDRRPDTYDLLVSRF